MLKSSYKCIGHKRIRRKEPVFPCLCVLVLLCSCTLSRAQGTSNSERLFSPSVSQRFYEIAYEMANPEDVTASEVEHLRREQAIVFLTAAMNLDSKANYVHPVLIKLASGYSQPRPSERRSQRDYSKLVSGLLADYVDEKADLEVIRKAISYLLGRLNSREEQEKTLEEMLRNLGSKNKVLGSELATALGLLMAEKPDLEAAQFYLMQAYNSSKYNNLAFAKLTEVMPEQIGPPTCSGFLSRLKGCRLTFIFPGPLAATIRSETNTNVWKLPPTCAKADALTCSLRPSQVKQQPPCLLSKTERGAANPRQTRY